MNANVWRFLICVGSLLVLLEAAAVAGILLAMLVLA